MGYTWVLYGSIGTYWDAPQNHPVVVQRLVCLRWPFLAFDCGVVRFGVILKEVYHHNHAWII